MEHTSIKFLKVDIDNDELQGTVGAAKISSVVRCPARPQLLCLVRTAAHRLYGFRCAVAERGCLGAVRFFSSRRSRS